MLKADSIIYTENTDKRIMTVATVWMIYSIHIKFTHIGNRYMTFRGKEMPIPDIKISKTKLTWLSVINWVNAFKRKPIFSYHSKYPKAFTDILLILLFLRSINRISTTGFVGVTEFYAFFQFSLLRWNIYNNQLKRITFYY